MALLSLFVVLFYAAISMVVVVAHLLTLRILLAHGKQLIGQSKLSFPRIVAFAEPLFAVTVPKSLFTCFYIQATLLSGILLFSFGTEYISSKENQIMKVLRSINGDHVTCADTSLANRNYLVALALFFMHVARRFLECVFLVNFGSSRMLCSHLIISVVYYFVTPLAMIVDAPTLACSLVKPTFEWYIWFGIVVFFIGNFIQHLVHRSLAAMRRPGVAAHGIPTGGLFELVSCPHYLGEIVLYLGLCIVTGFQSAAIIACFVWVVCCLTVNALNSHSWYHLTFPNYPRHRKALFPFVL